MNISQVSEKFNISKDTLRYYERIGLIPKVNRNKSGIRDYVEEDLNWIEFIKCMRNSGLTIEVLSEYVSLYKSGDTTLEARKELLISQEKALVKKMDEMQRTLNRLQYKIEKYDELVKKK